MTDLAGPKPRKYRGAVRRAAYGVQADTVVHNGAAIEEGTAGGAKNLTGAGTTFLGFAEESGNNNPGAVGDVEIRTVIGGDVLLAVTKASAWDRADVGADVYASDSDTFTLTSTSNQKIGKVAEVLEAAVGVTGSPEVWVAIESIAARSPT